MDLARQNSAIDVDPRFGYTLPVRLNEEMSSVSVTVYGVCAVSFMMAMYALEKRGRQFIFLFALGCLLSSVYGFLSGAWPFGVVEVIWSGIAWRRWYGAAELAS
jgi:hypothetical protein